MMADKFHNNSKLQNRFISKLTGKTDHGKIYLLYHLSY
jgi:hypothetical protein